MGNQIKFSQEDKGKSPNGAENLEIENIQLKATNRKLISKLDQHKQLIKKLNITLDTLKKEREFVDLNQLKSEYKSIKAKNENLESLLIQAKKEISRLKVELNNLKKEGEDSPSRWGKLKNFRK